MERKSKNSVSAFLRKNGLALLLAAGIFALMCAVVFRYRAVDGTFVSGQGAYVSDYVSHIVWAIGMSSRTVAASFVNGSERLWHVCVKFLFTHGVSNMWAAAAIVTAAADAAAYFIVYKAVDSILPEKQPRWLPALAVAAVFVVNSLALPGGSIYTAHGAVNTWHNPTNIMVRPFAAAVFFMTVRIYNRRRYGCHSAMALSGAATGDFVFADSIWAEFRRPVYTWFERIAYPVCLLCSAWAKPSFLQFFAPAILIFLVIDLIRTRGRLLPFCLKLALAYIPAGIVVCTQLFGFFGGSLFQSASAADAVQAAESAASGAGIAVYFIQRSFAGIGDFFSVTGQNILSGLICLCAFPLFVILAGGRQAWQDTSCRLGLIGMGVGWLEAKLLHETGSRAAHGNFFWGFYLSVWMLWAAAIGQYVRLVREPGRRGALVRWGGSALLIWHLSVGIIYLAQILQTGEYYF